VLTKGLAAEMKAGRALWGGVMTPAAPPAALAGPDPDPGGDKVLPDINIVWHAHMFLAPGEGVAPYEVTPELVTVDGAERDCRQVNQRNVRTSRHGSMCRLERSCALWRKAPPRAEPRRRRDVTAPFNARGAATSEPVTIEHGDTQ
jgi:hypothetical protein